MKWLRYRIQWKDSILQFLSGSLVTKSNNDGHDIPDPTFQNLVTLSNLAANHKIHVFLNVVHLNLLDGEHYAL
jgi:hypothetical protein